MNAQPNIDVKFINQILNSHGKKTTNPFYLNRLDIAINQLEKHNLIEGISARTVYYYLYINQPINALNFFNKTTRLYEDNTTFLILKIRIATTLGNWDLLKEAWLNYLFFLSDEERKSYIEIFITESNIFIDNDIPKDFSFFNKSKTQKEVFTKNLDKLDISIQTYRKIIEIIYQTISKYFNLIGARFNSFYKGDFLQIIIGSEVWQNEDLQILYQEVNDAILAIDDVDFQLEADNIEVIFINYPIKNLPHDFRLDNDDDDSDLITIVTQRMQENDGEMIKLEIENA